MNTQAVNDFVNVFHPIVQRRALTRSARPQRLPWRAMTTKKPSKGGSKSRSEAPNKGTKQGTARNNKPGKPLPGWLPALAEGVAPPPGRGRRNAEPPGPATGRKLPPAGKVIDDPYASREAEKYEQPIASREAILALLERCEGPQTAEELGARLGLTAPDRAEALSRRLGAMVRDGQLVQNRRGGFAPIQTLNLVTGVVIANPEGFGFLRPVEGGDDLFLPPYEMRKVMHGDKVLARVTGIDHRGRREGSIARVLERGMTRLIGRFSVEMGSNYVVPDD
jgi:ribonuclease R